LFNKIVREIASLCNHATKYLVYLLYSSYPGGKGGKGGKGAAAASDADDKPKGGGVSNVNVRHVLCEKQSKGEIHKIMISISFNGSITF
jgi:hypothetical protein